MSRKTSKIRKLVSGLFAFAVIVTIGVVNFYNGKLNRTSIWDWLEDFRTPRVTQRTAEVPIPKFPNSVRLGTFNIQVFGDAKLKNPDVMGVLADIARQFDVLAIQEIRTQNDSHVKTFVRMINAGGRKYDAAVGPRLGRSSSTEQYAFIYDTETVELVEGSLYTIEDRLDRLHREPLIARFRVRDTVSSRPFTFRLINIHTDPDVAQAEVDALADVFTVVQQQAGEDDVILLGDLNADTRNLGRLGYLPGVTPVVTRQFTNTRGTAMLDNIVFDSRYTIEAVGSGGVMNVLQMYGLTMDEMLQISDHLPVWADFSAQENSPGALVRRTDVQRY